jgi:hypothetical protein
MVFVVFLFFFFFFDDEPGYSIALITGANHIIHGRALRRLFVSGHNDVHPTFASNTRHRPFCWDGTRSRFGLRVLPDPCRGGLPHECIIIRDGFF